jgi:predicted transcriptional regulator
MSKAILISIRKEHNEKIFDHSKRFEGRKTCPKIITLGNHIDNTSTYNPSEDDVTCYVYEPIAGGGCGKVVGEFVCDFAQTFHPAYANMKMVANALCVTEDFAKQYFNREIGYMLRACAPKRYDEPKELREFRKPCDGNCQECRYALWQTYTFISESKIVGCTQKITIPQSWCYVEKMEQIDNEKMW